MVTTAGRQQAAHPSGDDRFARIDERLVAAGRAQDELIEILHVAQDAFGYLSEDVLRYVARQLRLPPSHVYGVASFYHLFELEPPGDHACTICIGTACFVKGADEIVRKVTEHYRVAPGGTSEDRRLTLRTARCLGSCGLAPFVEIDDVVHAHQTADTTLASLATAVDRNGTAG